MTQYLVIAEEGIDYNGHHLPKDDVIDLPDDEYTQALVNQGVIVAVDSQIQPTGVVGQGPFSVTVNWTADSSEADRAEAATGIVKTIVDEANAPEAIPACIEQIVITRL